MASVGPLSLFSEGVLNRNGPYIGKGFGGSTGSVGLRSAKAFLPAVVLLCAVAAISSADAASPVCGGTLADKLVTYKFAAGKTIDVAIERPLTKRRGEAVQGLRIVVDPERGNCIACHRVAAILAKLDIQKPSSREKYGNHGTLGPRLDGIAERYSEGELRAILVNPQVAFPDADTIMPSYYTVGNFNHPLPDCRDRAILSANEIENVLAYLATLK